MSSYKEIVTKTVIGKGKKEFRDKYEVSTNEKVDTVLGCWIINHKLEGKCNNDKVLIEGEYDTNIWYSYDNNTKTNVVNKKVYYKEEVKVNLKEDTSLNSDTEILLRSLKNPNCVDVNNKDKTIEFIVEKEIGIELIGDAKVKIAVEDDYDDYEVIEDEKNALDEIDKEVEEDYLEKKMST